MAYGLSTRAFVEQGSVEQLSKLESARSMARSWSSLNPACRLAIVERALGASNDGIDGYPLAL